MRRRLGELFDKGTYVSKNTTLIWMNVVGEFYLQKLSSPEHYVPCIGDMDRSSLSRFAKQYNTGALFYTQRDVPKNMKLLSYVTGKRVRVVDEKEIRRAFR